jgi:hypothetical protein
MVRNRLRRDCARKIVDRSTIYAATDDRDLLKIDPDRDLLVVVLVEIPVKILGTVVLSYVAGCDSHGGIHGDLQLACLLLELAHC